LLLLLLHLLLLHLLLLLLLLRLLLHLLLLIKPRLPMMPGLLKLWKI